MEKALYFSTEDIFNMEEIMLEKEKGTPVSRGAHSRPVTEYSTM